MVRYNRKRMWDGRNVIFFSEEVSIVSTNSTFKMILNPEVENYKKIKIEKKDF